MGKSLFVYILTFFTATVFSSTDAQPLRRLNSFSYNINDGLLQSSILDMNFDGVGFMWLSFETGLQRYDGNNFTNVPIQKGLPDNQNVNFLKSANGLLWLCHSKGISIYNATTNHFTVIFSYISKAPAPSIWPLNEDEGIVYFYESDGYIIGINETTLRVTGKNRFPFTTDRFEAPPEFKTFGYPINHEVMICFDMKELITWNLQKGIATSKRRLPKNVEIGSEEFYTLSNSRCIFFANGHLNVFNPEKDSLTPHIKNQLDQKNIDGSSF